MHKKQYIMLAIRQSDEYRKRCPIMFFGCLDGLTYDYSISVQAGSIAEYLGKDRELTEAICCAKYLSRDEVVHILHEAEAEWDDLIIGVKEYKEFVEDETKSVMDEVKIVRYSEIIYALAFKLRNKMNMKILNSQLIENMVNESKINNAIVLGSENNNLLKKYENLYGGLFS